jgi:hypothetical protein
VGRYRHLALYPEHVCADYFYPGRELRIIGMHPAAWPLPAALMASRLVHSGKALIEPVLSGDNISPDKRRRV